MKLLLTSNGLANDSIRAALRELVGTDAIRIAFIPTAANVDQSDKDWLINDFVNARKLGPVDIVDISALPRSNWLPRLEAVNVIVMGGGNTFYLLHWLEQSGLKTLLPELLKTRVYVGISAGSIVTNPSLSMTHAKQFYGQGEDMTCDSEGLGFVNFFVRPHLNSPHFPNIRVSLLKEKAKDLPGALYAIDDQSALKVVDDKVEIISEGDWAKLP